MTVIGAESRRLGDSVAELLETVDRHMHRSRLPPVVVASVAFQMVTKNLVHIVDRAGDVPAFAHLTWSWSRQGLRLSVREPPDPCRSGVTAVPALVERAVEPWVEVMARNQRIGRRLLWANATASVLYRATQRVPSTAFPRQAFCRDLADAVPGGLLATVFETPASPAFRRSACCLIDRIPGHDRCDECPLDRSPSRSRRSDEPRARAAPGDRRRVEGLPPTRA